MHLMPAAAWNKLAGWFWLLMFRLPREVPRRLVTVWAISWATVLLSAWLGGIGFRPVPVRTSGRLVPGGEGALVAAGGAWVPLRVGTVLRR